MKRFIRSWPFHSSPRLLPLIKIAIRDGRLQVDGMDAWYHYWRDPYHLLLTISWIGFLLVVGGLYIALNAGFALLYLAGRDPIANATPGSFGDAFFFSVQTFASIGYGAMYPQTFYANAVMTLEAITAIISIAVLTGLAFARFTRSTARIMFSQYAVVTPFQGVPTLMVRAANQRRNHIREGQVQMYLMCDELDESGLLMRRFYDLPLLRSRTPSFILSWTLMHPIDESSPIYQETSDSLLAMQAEIMILIQGMDSTVSQPVYANHAYTIGDIFWGYQFADILQVTPEGYRYLNFNDFHRIIPTAAVSQGAGDMAESK